MPAAITGASLPGTAATIKLSAGCFEREKPLSWASRHLAEATALAALGLAPLDPDWRPPPCRGRDDRCGSDRHLANALRLARPADAITVQQAAARAALSPAAAPVPLEDALARHFALDLRFDIVETADILLTATTAALERRFGDSGPDALRSLHAQPPLPERAQPAAFARLLTDAVTGIATTCGLERTPFRIVDGSQVAKRMWRRWFNIDGQIVYVVGQAVPGPQDIARRLVHDAAHVAHLCDLEQTPLRGAALGDAPYIVIAEGFAMLSEAGVLGLLADKRPRHPAPTLALLELELLQGFVERAIRFSAEVNDHYSTPSLERLAERSGFKIESVATTVREWRGLVGMGSCYMLGLLVALKTHASGNLRDVLRYQADPPPLERSDVERLTQALERL